MTTRWLVIFVAVLFITRASAQNRLDESTNPTSIFSNLVKTVKGEVGYQNVFSLNYGVSFGPNSDQDFALASFQLIYDNEKALLKPVHIKLEVAAGTRIKRCPRGVLSCGIFAHYYLDGLRNDTFRPYLDAGTGMIFTDFQNPGQGLRGNFKSSLSIATEIHTSPNSEPWFIAMRVSHLSNADLHEDNSGLDSAMILVGRHF